MSLLACSPLTAMARNLAVAGAMGAALVAPSHAVTFTEVGDAGQTQATAQSTLPLTGALTDIFGSLLSSTDADLYVINITNPGAFSASTFNAVGGFLDTQLFLMTLSGAPVYINDDDAGGQTVLSTLPAGSGLGPLTAGTYLLGVSLSGYDPVNIANQLLFASNPVSTTVRGPASGLQPAFLGGFSDGTFYSDSGSYDIKLTGVNISVAAPVPEPSTTALLAVGGALCAYAVRRRRGAADGAKPSA